jgi:hypothetical protein
MSSWSKNELTSIADADELNLTAQRKNGTMRPPVTIWVVRDGDDLYVRSIHGRNGVWFQATQQGHQGRVNSGGVQKDVRFEVDPDPGLNDRIDQAYRSKYHHYGAKLVDTVVNPNSRVDRQTGAALTGETMRCV